MKDNEPIYILAITVCLLSTFLFSTGQRSKVEKLRKLNESRSLVCKIKVKNWGKI